MRFLPSSKSFLVSSYLRVYQLLSNMAPGALLDESSQNAVAGGYSDTTIPAINITKQSSWDSIMHRNARTTPLTLRSASGNWLEVSDSNKSWAVFDGSGGAAVTCIGHKDYRVMKAEWDHFHSTGLTYAPSGSFRTEISEEFADHLIRTTNNMMAKVVFYGSGIRSAHLMHTNTHSDRF